MKYLIIVLSVILMCEKVIAQGDYIELRAGINQADISAIDLLERTETRSCFQGGLYYHRQVMDEFVLGVGVESSQKGFLQKIDFTDEQGVLIERKYTGYIYDYVSIPIKFGVSIGDRFSGGFFHLGLIPSVLYNAELRYPSFQEFEAFTQDMTNSVSAFDYAGLVELGGVLRMTDHVQLMLAFTYQHSFTDFSNDDYFSEANARHYGIVFSGGLRYVIRVKSMTD